MNNDIFGLRGTASVDVKETFGWSRYRFDDICIWLKGYLFNNDAQGIAAFLSGEPSTDSLATFFQSLDGHFALIASYDDKVLAAVDWVRSIPLFYAEHDGAWCIDDQSERLRQKAGLIQEHISSDGLLSLAMGGFTIGSDTLYAPLHQLSCGSFVLFSKNHLPHVQRYYAYAPWKNLDRDEVSQRECTVENFRHELAGITLNVFRKLIESAGGRTIAIPLSAGRDSRLVASALVHLGYNNLKCFSYGQKSNFEISTAKAIAEKLGVEWCYVPYTRSRQRKNLTSALHDQYLEFADSNSSVPFEQDFLAVRTLKESAWLPEDAIIINGNSGDFISGNHIPSTLYTSSDDVSMKQREEIVLNALINKHFSLWERAKTPENISRIKKRLRKSLRDEGISWGDDDKNYGIYEFSEFQDRQCKYVISGQRVYEFFGYDWRLPLWDNDYIRFWERVPLQYKIEQNLYLDMLNAENWGGVWRGIPINAKTVRPLWLVVPRLIAKGLFVFSNQKKWHEWQNRLFAYFMEPLCLYSFVKYEKICKDSRGFRNVVSYLCERYLTSKKIDLSKIYDPL